MSDLRGPMRTWIEIKETSSATFIMLECGHVGEMNPIFDYSLDPQHHCFQCGQDEINIPQKGDGGILRGSSNSSQVRDSLISGVVTGAAEEPRKSESTESRPRHVSVELCRAAGPVNREPDTNSPLGSAPEELRQYNGHMLNDLWRMSDALFTTSGRETTDAAQAARVTRIPEGDRAARPESEVKE